MFNIADFLKKFSKFESDSRLTHETVQQSLHAHTGKSDIPFEVRKGIVYIRASGALKSAIYLKKALILAMINERAPQARIQDLR